MNKMFTQPTGPVAKQTNKQAIARLLSLKQSDVGYLSTTSPITGYSVLFDPVSQKTWDIGSATGTPISWTVSGAVLTLTTDTGIYTLALALIPADLVGYSVTGMSGYRTAQDSLADFVNLHDYHLDSDSTWDAAFTRAFAVSTNILIPWGTHEVSESIVLPAGANVIGLGAPSLVKCRDAINAGATNLVTVFTATGVDGIILSNLTVDGGVREINTVKRSTRTMRFRNCTNVQLLNIRVLNNADWATSFEGGSDIVVKDYYQRSYEYTDTSVNLNGGRDGLHFMNVSNVYAENLDIESGDDCVGITTEGTDMDNITIKGLRGSSKIASLVIFNEEQDSTGTYYSCNLTNLTINDIAIKSGGTARNIVRVVGYAEATTISNVSITNVKGTAYNSYGLWLSKAVGVHLDDINVKSQLAHGIYLNGISRLTGSAAGAYTGGNASDSFIGININNVTDSVFTPISYASYGFGVQIIGCSYCTFTPNIQDCGSGLLATNAGGNLRVTNCVGVNIPHGLAWGDSTVSYWGLLQTGNTNLEVGLEFKYSGATNSVLPNSYYYKRPVVDIKLKEASDGTVTTHILTGGTIVRNSTGNFTITFNQAMRSTNFSWQALAYFNGYIRHVRLASAVGDSGLTLQIVDNAAAVAYADHFEFKAFNVVGS